MSDNYSEDEFEDYEDDFEFDEIEAADKSYQPQNDWETIQDPEDEQSATGKAPQLAYGFGPRIPNRQGKKILPSKEELGWSDQKRQLMQTKQKRYNNILSKIKLQEFIVEDSFELKPMTQFELYHMGRGQYQTCRVAATTFHDQVFSQDAQTDQMERSSTGCQVPEDLSSSYQPCLGQQTKKFSKSSYDLQIIGKFLLQIEPTIHQMLGNGQQQDLQFVPLKQPISISSTCFTLTQLSILKHRRLECVSQCSQNSNTLLIGYQPAQIKSSINSAFNDSMGLIAVWDLKQPLYPRKLLLCHGAPVCCSSGNIDDGSSQQCNIVVAGLDDGSVVTWDLRENQGNSFILDDKSCIQVDILHQSYSNSHVAEQEFAGPVVHIDCYYKHQGANKSNESLFLLSCNQFGYYSVFQVQQYDSVTAETGYVGHDMGTTIGSLVYLQRCGVPINVLSSKQRDHVSHTSTTCMKIHKQNNQIEYFAGLDTEYVIHGCVESKCDVPLQYNIAGDVCYGLNVTQHDKENVGYAFNRTLACCEYSVSLDVSCNCQTIVAGCTHGKVCLFHRSSSLPIKTWQLPDQGHVIQVKYIPGTSFKFIALTNNNFLYCFDLQRDAKEFQAEDKVTCLLGTSDQTSAQATRLIAIQQNKSRIIVVVGFINGSIQCYCVRDGIFSVDDEQETINFMLDR